MALGEKKVTREQANIDGAFVECSRVLSGLLTSLFNPYQISLKGFYAPFTELETKAQIGKGTL